MRDSQNEPDIPRIDASHTSADVARNDDTKSTTKTVEIKISLPAMPDFTPITTHPVYGATRARTEKLRSNKLVLGGIILAVVLSVIGNYAFPTRGNVTADKGSEQALTKGTPDYNTVLPAGKTIHDLGGWTRVSPVEKDPVFAYVDTIGAVKIIVSQQPLPDSFAQDKAAKIEALAKDYSATEKITVDGEIVYIGTSEKGPQSLILSRDDLLILIKSSLQVDSNEWAKYINSLH